MKNGAADTAVTERAIDDEPSATVDSAAGDLPPTDDVLAALADDAVDAPSQLVAEEATRWREVAVSGGD